MLTRPHPPVQRMNLSECELQREHYATSYRSQPMPLPLLVLFTVVASLIILLTIFGNLLVLCFKARVGRTNTTLLVWNLGLTDFLVGMFVLPLGAFHIIAREWRLGRFMCRLWVAADVTFCTCSVVTICIISVDRYLAVTRPLRYKSVVTKTKVITAMVVIWSFSTSILLTTVRWDQPHCLDTTICFVGHEIRYLAHSVVFAFFLPASVTLTLYWRIYRLARNRQRALDRGFLIILGQNMNFLTNTISQQTTLRVHFGKNNGMVEHQRRVLRTHERIAKTLGVVSCSFLFCWLPFFGLYLTRYCNSMLNPIIYSFTVKEFKRSAIRLVLPVWNLLHRVLPTLIPMPPEHITSRVSRTGAWGKPRRRSFDFTPNRRKLIASQMATVKRRQTVPAVLKVIEKQSNEEETVLEDTTKDQSEVLEGHLMKQRHDSRRRQPRPNRLANFKKRSNSERDDLQPSLDNEVHFKWATHTTKTISLNGVCDSLPTGTVRVYCLTKEASL